MNNKLILSSMAALLMVTTVVRANPNDPAQTKNGTFMECQLAGKSAQGSVILSAQNRVLSLNFDAGAQSVLGLAQATVDVIVDTFSTGPITGPLDFLEMNKSGGACDIGIDFAHEGQTLALHPGSEIPLKHATPGVDGYRSVRCGQQKMFITSCAAAGTLKNVEDIGHYLNVVEGD